MQSTRMLISRLNKKYVLSVKSIPQIAIISAHLSKLSTSLE